MKVAGVFYFRSFPSMASKGVSLQHSTSWYPSGLKLASVRPACTAIDTLLTDSGSRMPFAHIPRPVRLVEHPDRQCDTDFHVDTQIPLVCAHPDTTSSFRIRKMQAQGYDSAEKSNPWGAEWAAMSKKEKALFAMTRTVMGVGPLDELSGFQVLSKYAERNT